MGRFIEDLSNITVEVGQVRVYMPLSCTDLCCTYHVNYSFIDHCVFNINYFQDAKFVCVVSEIHVSRPQKKETLISNQEELIKEFQFIEINYKEIFNQGYRLGWAKADSKAILAVGTHVITHDNRCCILMNVECHVTTNHLSRMSCVHKSLVTCHVFKCHHS